MPSIRSIILYGLSICSFCTAEVQPERKKEFSIDEAVRWLPEESVRAALRNNLAPKYRDGVFEHGKKAIEAIKHADPQLASKVVDEALQREMLKEDLKKRQNSNSTSSDSSPPPSSNPPPPPSSSSPPPPSSNPPPPPSSGFHPVAVLFQ